MLAILLSSVIFLVFFCLGSVEEVEVGVWLLCLCLLALMSGMTARSCVVVLGQCWCFGATVEVRFQLLSWIRLVFCIERRRPVSVLPPNLYSSKNA